MRIPIAAAIVFSLGAPAIAVQQPRGVVTDVTVTADVAVGTFNFAVRGRNPCGAVRLHTGDTEAITHAIVDLPVSIKHEFVRTGDFVVRAEGMGNCDGEATTRVRVTRVRPQPPPPPPAPPPPPPDARPIRFAAMDRNGDRVISRGEWRGSAVSFDVHDWNGDGRLSGEEVRPGATQALSGRGRGNVNTTREILDWSENRFQFLDRNRDNRISMAEWRDDFENFRRVDRNGDGVLSLSEFLISDIDDDRGDRFDDLDLNRDNRLDLNEWHGSVEAFRWLDRNGDGRLSRVEVVGSDQITGRVSGNPGTTTSGTTVKGSGRGSGGGILVSSTEPWTDTGIMVRMGDVLVIRATGAIQYGPDRIALVESAGDRRVPATNTAPVPGAAIGALVGRVGTSEPFMIGGRTDTIRAPRDGRLYLGVNDDILTDNSGEFRVTVTVTRR